MVIVKTNVTISATVVLTLLIIGFQSSVFAQSTNSLGLSILGNSQIDNAEMIIDQKLDDPQQKIGSIDLGNFMNMDVSEILEKLREIIPFSGNNLGGIPGQIGVLVYTHGLGYPGSHDPEKTEPIKEALEKIGYPTEIITHMPYNWDEGLQKLR